MNKFRLLAIFYTNGKNWSMEIWEFTNDVAIIIHLN